MLRKAGGSAPPWACRLLEGRAVARYPQELLDGPPHLSDVARLRPLVGLRGVPDGLDDGSLDLRIFIQELTNDS